MGNRRFEFALRTIIVSTRAAVRSHHAARRDELADASIERGLALLEGLRSALPPDEPGGSESVDEAHRELTSLLGTAGVPVIGRE